jgi:hypothetical protein
MKTRLKSARLALLWLILVSCSNAKGEGSAAARGQAGPDKTEASATQSAALATAAPIAGMGQTAREYRQAVSLEQMAETERQGGFRQGMGLAESALRENEGDYAGAALAAYKELAWAYGYGQISRESIEDGLKKVIGLCGDDDRKKDAATASEAALAFAKGNWKAAEALILPLFQGEAEADAFSAWMLLACSLEQSSADKAALSRYSSIRSRYATFPEYWYRGARHFTASIAADHAERCVNLAGGGPFSAECRSIIAKSVGLNEADGPSMRTRIEIEAAVREAIQTAKPEALSDLVPLLALPDNEYTLYAAGAMRALSGMDPFAAYFAEQRGEAEGRARERLAYIVGNRQ